MDKNNYSVDEILEEIKRKKQVKLNEKKSNDVNFSKNTEIKYSNENVKETEEVKEYRPSYKHIESYPYQTEEKVYQPQTNLRAEEPNQDIGNSNQCFDNLRKENKPNTSFEKQNINNNYNELSENSCLTDEENNFGESKSERDAKLAAVFGDNAFKPYETKSAVNLKEKHIKKFSAERDENVQAPYINEFEEKKEEIYHETVSNISNQNFENKNNQKNVSEKDEIYAKNDSKSFEEEKPCDKSHFKVNLKDNFFDQDDKENTNMNIKVGNMDSSKAAMGFTRSIPILDRSKKSETDSEETDKRNNVEEYNSPEDIESVKNHLKKLKLINIIQLIITVVIFGVLLYWGIALNNVKLPLPSFMLPEENMQMFIGMSLGFLILNTLACYSVVGGGLISLFTLKPNGDTAVSLAVIASIIQGASLVALPERILDPGVNMYFCLPSLALLFNLLGKTFMYSRIKRNFDFVTSEEEKYTLGIMNNLSFEKEITRGQNIESPCVVYSSKTKFPTDFLKYSNSPDYSDGLSIITIPIFLVFSIIMAAVSYFFGEHDFMISLTVFSALMCMGAPLSSTWLSNLPLNRISKSLSEEGAMIAGYKSLDDFDEMNSLSIDANDLFVSGSIVMHGIKTFSNSRIDEAIIDAASVACSSSGILMDIFMEMIQHNQSLLKKVDSIIYEDEMGLSAWVDGKKVLIGNRNLMINHGMTPPSIEYENKFKKDGREVFYLANSGELTAMFVISYIGSEDIKDYLYELSEKGVTLSVYTTDPNITAAKIEEIFEYPQDMVTVMGSKNHAEFNEISCDKERYSSEIVYNGSLAAKIKSVCDVISGKSAVVLGTILQLIFIVGGYGLISFLALMGKMDMASFQFIAIYQLISVFLVTLIPNLRKY